MAVSSGPASALAVASGVAMGYHLAFVTGGLGSSVPRPPVHRLAPAKLPRPAPPSGHRQPSSRPRRGPPPPLPPPRSPRRGPQSLPSARRRRDEFADDDVLLEAQQVVHGAGDGRLCEDAGRLLEGSGGQEAVRVERGLGHAQEHRLRRGGLSALRQHLGVHRLKPEAVHKLARQQHEVARGVDSHASQHLAKDHLNVLIVDRHALGAVDLLDLLHEVYLNGLRPLDAQDVLWVQGAIGQGLAGVNLVVVLDPQAGRGRHRVLALVALLQSDGERLDLPLSLDGDLALPLAREGALPAGPGQDLSRRHQRLLVALLRLRLRHLRQHGPLLHVLAVLHQHLHALRQGVIVTVEFRAHDLDPAHVALAGDLRQAVDLGDEAGALRDARLEQLLDAGQTGGDVDADDAAGVERAHGELRAGLADALGGDDPDGLSLRHQPVARQVPAVAGRTDPPLGLAGEGGAHVDPIDPGRDDPVGRVLHDLRVSLDDDFAGLGMGDVCGGPASDYALVQGLEQPLLRRLTHPDAGGGAAVIVLDDHVLSDVDQAAGEGGAVGGAEGGVGQARAGAGGGDEVLQHGEAFTEGGADRQVYDAACRVDHQAAHARHLRDLADVTLGAADRHQVHATVLAQPFLYQLLHLVVGVAPDGDRLAIALLIRDEAHVELVLDLGDGPVGGGEELL